MVEESVADSADAGGATWAELRTAIAAATVPVEVLGVDAETAAAALATLGVTTGSVLGALALNCGGLLIDHGWVRVLGGGTDRLPGLAEANQFGTVPAVGAAPAPLIVGFDVLGGRFAIDGGGLGIARGEVCYWAPDTLEWESLDLGHGGFVQAFLDGAADGFYQQWRWDG